MSNPKKGYLEQKLNKIDQSHKEIDRNLLEAEKIQKELTHIQSQTCPTCEQTWVGDNATKHIDLLKAKIKDLGEKTMSLFDIVGEKSTVAESLEALTAESNAIDINKESQPFDDKISEKNDLIKNLQQSILKNQQEINILSASVDAENRELQKTRTNKLAQIAIDYNTLKLPIQKQISENDASFSEQKLAIQSELSKLESDLRVYESAFATAKTRSEKLIKEIGDNQVKLNDYLEQTAQINGQIEIASEAKKVIKAYLMQVFQESLDYISERATNMMGQVPNVSNASIRFEGYKETKNGSIKDEVSAIVNLDGENDINIKTLSGGERSSVDLAVDLALIEMIEYKVGKGADFFVLDEPFDGLDSVNKGQCLDLLLALDTNKRMIIVDHSTETKAMITDVITVVRDGEESKII